MNAPNFASILDDAPDHVERPKPLPVGTYTFVVGPWIQGRSSKKGTPYIEFTLRAIAADDDVDPDELDEVGGLEGKTLRVTFYENAIFRLDEFHEHCGVDLTVPLSRRQRNDEVVNAQVKAYVSHRTVEGADTTFAEIKRTLPAD